MERICSGSGLPDSLLASAPVPLTAAQLGDICEQWSPFLGPGKFLLADICTVAAKHKAPKPAGAVLFSGQLATRLRHPCY